MKRAYGYTWKEAAFESDCIDLPGFGEDAEDDPEPEHLLVTPAVASRCTMLCVCSSPVAP